METMFKLKNFQQKRYIILVVLLLGLSACAQPTLEPVEESATPLIATETVTQQEPSATTIPAAAWVNGEPISMAFFDSEVNRYLLAQDELGQPPEDDSEALEIVLNDLINQVLLAQGAQEVGLSVSDAEVQAKIDSLAAETDLAEWMATWGYSEGELFEALKLQMLAAAQRDAIAESVPETAQQVEIRQILAYTEEGANSALVSLRSGRTFEDVAFTYDPVTGGYLGWVPRGYLLVPAVEEAAFNLEVGNYSEIIPSDVGFHIVMVLDRAERPLTSDARLVLMHQAVQDWLFTRRESSTIEVIAD
jgi:parvulin-like peptidyl-prolyl isomerase